MAALVGLVSAIFIPNGRAANPGAGGRYELRCTVLDYSPTGKKKVHATPTLTTAAKLSCSFMEGSEKVIPSPAGKGVDFVQCNGYSFRATIQDVRNGKIRLDAVLEMKWEEKAPNNGLRLRGKTLRCMQTLRLGQAVKLELKKGAGKGGRLVVKIVVLGAGAG
jgi:hypothetical protein